VRAILTYHSVDPSGSPISIDEAAFRSHVAWLASGAVPVVPLERIAEPGAHGDAVALSFDDAFGNFAGIAWPLLRARRLPVTLFVVSGHAGGTNAWGGREAAGIPTLPLMDWDAVGRVAEEGVTLGAHSRTHPDLRELPAAALAEETAGSADDIAARTGVRPPVFAYPFGAVSEAVASVAAATFRLAVTTELRALEPDDSPLRLPRLDAFYLQGRGRLEAWDTAAFRAHLRLRAGLRRVRAALTGRPA
jgi:peptidoglycan/xylan/chitin deacetylase (PgdA/CDA1 family)